ncbi:MAG: aminoglycoside phosphotransferase family protein [Bacteroidota bacterium]|nr:aminoglycoside phosphotransferase family protein [Bacteroidota bacterium]
MLASILTAFGIAPDQCNVLPFGNGLINHTWKIEDGNSSYILQRVNDKIFKSPAHIANNIRAISDYFAANHPDYLFVSPIKSTSNNDVVCIEGMGYYRLFPFVKDAHTVDTVQTPAEAYEAAKQFGRFTKLLAGFDISKLKITIPDFHNLSLRYHQFQQSLCNGSQERIATSGEAIRFLQEHVKIVQEFEAIQLNKNFKLRVTHHDTKISNILFDNKNCGLCVIDLDTVMPGYFISDIGDMMRTYLCPVSEEEKDFSKIEVRTGFFEALVNGYLHEMNDELTKQEKTTFTYAGKFLIYMQALRFITDYFNNDIYYGAKYPEQNFVRAQNQVVLLQKLLDKEEEFKTILS